MFLASETPGAHLRLKLLLEGLPFLFEQGSKVFELNRPFLPRTLLSPDMASPFKFDWTSILDDS